MNTWKVSRFEKLQACYQHTCLLNEQGFKLTNQILRERFGMHKNNSAGAARIISDTVDAGLIHLSEKAPDSNTLRKSRTTHSLLIC